MVIFILCFIFVVSKSVMAYRFTENKAINHNITY